MIQAKALGINYVQSPASTTRPNRVHLETFEWLSLLPIAGRWHLLQFRAKLPRQFAEGGRTRPLCEIAAVQMKSGKVLVEAFEVSN